MFPTAIRRERLMSLTHCGPTIVLCITSCFRRMNTDNPISGDGILDDSRVSECNVVLLTPVLDRQMMGATDPTRQNPNMNVKNAFKLVSWDMNHDTVVTCEEWKAYPADLFASGDQDSERCSESGRV